MLELDISNGMDNRQRAEAIPEGYVRNVVNIQYDPTGKAKRVAGATQVYSGANIHSLWEGYFIEGTQVKRIDSNQAVSTIRTVSGDPAGFTRVGSNVYYGDSNDSLVIEDDTLVVKPLGIPWPESQPTLSSRTSGGMHAGEYQVSMTYLRADGEESGCGVASKVTLTEGQGIYASITAVAPTDVTQIAIYVSSINGDELFLYGEYDDTTTEVFIDNNLSSIRLISQFMYPPLLSSILREHYGRLYWADGALLRYTEAGKYIYTKANNYAHFESDISIIVAVPGTLYVCADKTYKITGIDTDGFMQRETVLPYGAVPGTAYYDERTQTAFWQSHKGIVVATSEGAQELVASNIAMPKYDKGALTITERSGVRQIVAVSQGGTPSDLLDTQFRAEEITRTGSAL